MITWGEDGKRMHEVLIEADAEGRLTVLVADPDVWISDELWKAITSGEVAPAEWGGPVFAGEVLNFGRPGQGLGRVAYRYLRYQQGDRVHVLERVGR